MSDWLERELARGLAPVAAPEALGVRLGFERARRRGISPRRPRRRCRRRHDHRSRIRRRPDRGTRFAS